MSLSKIELQGSQIANFFIVRDGQLSSSEIEEYLDIAFSDTDAESDSSTLLFARFNNGLDAGTYNGEGETLDGWSIYKQIVGESRLHYVTSVSLSASSIIDHLVRNSEEYIYYLFPVGENAMGTPLTTGEVSSLVWNWVLFLAEETDTDNVLTVTNAYVFQGNVSTNTMSNNAESTVLHNFTQYPKIIKGTTNYKSGTLQALIGYVDYSANTYTESDGLRDALMELSTSQSRMFLKNRAGDIWEVSIHEEVQMQVDDVSSYQPNTATITWTEIASTDDISLIGEV